MKIDIKCPKCSWKPGSVDKWACSCGFIWNTFETGGKCPQCSKQWEYTQCLGPPFASGCRAWSKHIDWYHILDDGVIEFKEVEVKKSNIWL